ncbi:hypothetical protein V2J09_003613 [Rumex salicifolius]
MEGKKVMIAIDGSDCSNFAVEWAVSNLRPVLDSGAEIILFTAVSTDYSGVAAASYGTAHYTNPVLVALDLVATNQEKQEELAIAILNKAKNVCANYGIDAETVYESGSPKEEICEAVDKYQVQLLVLGSHGKGTIQRAFLGSVSNYCVNNAKCPVMVVRKPPA